MKARFKIGDRVSTPYGEGVIVGTETNRAGVRFIVKLDDENNVFKRLWDCNPAFWTDELTKL